MQEIETSDDAMRFLNSIMSTHENETPGMYLNFINRFLENASIPELEGDASPLLRYVVSLMQNPFIQIMVFTHPGMATIFRATTMRFVLARLKQMNFQRQCAQSAARDIQHAYQYAPNMRGNGWSALVSKVATQYEDFGFDKKFMENLLNDDGALEPQKWNKLIIDWTTALKRKLEHQEVSAENSTETSMFRAIEQADKEVQNYLLSSHVSDKEAFEESINLMHGIWNRTEYERVQPIVRLQRKYPNIAEVVNVLGRIPEEEGKRRISIATGCSLKIEHSAGSDIEGVTTSRQLVGLLPSELALYSDDQLSDIFWHKYMQGNLQSFRYRSNLAKPTRKLTRSVQAKPRGPMIVCVDTSGSMMGEPIRIAQSILGKVVSMAHRQNRCCYLIYYSCGIKTADLTYNSWAMDELRNMSSGGTDATRMLTEVFRLLSQDENYMCADILWISDFMVPDVSNRLLQQMQEFRNSDTRFYGYQIGDHETIWDTRMNKMYHCNCSPEKKM